MKQPTATLHSANPSPHERGKCMDRIYVSIDLKISLVSSAHNCGTRVRDPVYSVGMLLSLVRSALRIHAYTWNVAILSFVAWLWFSATSQLSQREKQQDHFS